MQISVSRVRELIAAEGGGQDGDGGGGGGEVLDHSDALAQSDALAREQLKVIWGADVEAQDLA